MEPRELDGIRAAEAERRQKLLGDLVNLELEPTQLQDRSAETDIPVSVLWEWRQHYWERGREGLLPPDWGDLTDAGWALALERKRQLGALADAETITDDQIALLAHTNGWSLKRTRRWLRRYRIVGLRGLAPLADPDKPTRRHRRQPTIRDLGTLDEATLEEVYRRRDLLGNLTDAAKVSDAEVRSRAKEVGVSPRTLWGYLTAYRKHGLAGLAPQQRADKDLNYRITPRMREIIVGIRLSQPDLRIRAVWEAACEKAHQLGEVEPSEWQVRSICNNIPEPVKLIAAGRHDEFRNKYRFTYRIQFDGSHVIYFFDHTQIDVLVKDLRDEEVRAPSGEIRPWLSLAICPAPRLCIAAIFSYDRPNRFTVAALIRDALLLPLQRPYGGIPLEIWVDQGKDLVSRHVQELTRELGITLHRCAPHQPQQKGIIERFFGMLNTRLWSTLPGYVGSNVVERNPSVKAGLTISQVVERFWAFIEQYHHEAHSETGKTPLDYWAEHCLAIPADPRQLDMLLKESATRRVIKAGIKYESRLYWHSDLATLVGQDVLIRAEPSSYAPDEIEVFHRGQWICTAFATDSPAGRVVQPDDISDAQIQQRQAARETIDNALSTLEDAERAAQEAKRQQATQHAGPPVEPKQPTEQPPESKPSDKKKSSDNNPKPDEQLPSLLDLL